MLNSIEMNWFSWAVSVGRRDYSSNIFFTEQQILYNDIFAQVDQRLSELTDIPNELAHRLLSHAEASESMEATVEGVAQLMKDEGDLVCTPILFGAAPLQKGLWQALPVDERQRRIVPLEIKRSAGLYLHKAEIRGYLDPRLVDNLNPVAVLEDLVDKGGVLIALTIYIIETRLSLIGDDEFYRKERLLDAKSNLENYSQISYPHLLNALKEANILLAFPFLQESRIFYCLTRRSNESVIILGSCPTGTP